ncbi:MAG: ATP-dependent helicase/nuclease subunit B, partial [Sphingobacteriales bacterium]
QFLTFSQLTSWTQQSLFSFFWDQPSIQDFEKKFPDGYCRLQGNSEIPCIQYLQMAAQQNSATHFLSDWKSRMLEKDFQQEDAIFVESYHRFLSFLSETEQALADNNLEFELPGLSFISRSFIQGEEIDLVGEPLTNHQIMGLLETRGLSFEQVIFCGANEKAIPGNSRKESFIPTDLRTAFGLPGIKEKEAVFSYYFFMLVFASKNIHLLYLADSALNKGDEPSRYLRQLEFIAKENPNWNWVNKPVISKIGQTPSTPIIYRTAAINTAIAAYAKKKFSASSINLFFTSPLNFVLEKILKIRDNDAVSEQQSPMEFGDIIHTCLEDLFKPFIGKTIGLEDITGFDTRFERIFDNITQAKFGKPKDKLLGLKRINIELGKEILSSYLLDEAKDLKKIKDQGNTLSIFDLEKHVEREFVGKRMSFYLHGFIDRVDRIGSEIRLLDYKTGKAKIKPRDLEETILNPDTSNNVARQLILYAWMMVPYCRENNYTLSTGVYSFKEDKIGKEFISKELDEYEEMGNTILQHLEDNLFFGEADFVHPENLKKGYGIIE